MVRWVISLTVAAVALAGLLLATWSTSPDSAHRTSPSETGAKNTDSVDGTDGSAPEARPNRSDGTTAAAASGDGLKPTASVPSGSAPLNSPAQVPKSETPEGAEARPATEDGMPVEVRRHGRTDDEGLVEIEHPDGTVTVDLQGRFRSVPIATQDDAGNVQIRE